MEHQDTPTDLGKAALCVAANLRKASRGVSQVYSAALRPVGLQGSQFSLLAAAASRGGSTLNALADHLVMDRTTLTRNLRPLEKRGLIRVAPGAEDRRTRVVDITDEGRALLMRAVPLWQRAQDAMLAGLGEEDWQRIRPLLGRAVDVAADALVRFDTDAETG